MLRFAQYCHKRGSPTTWTSPGRPEGVLPEDPLMDHPIKVPSWWGNNWLHDFSCSHRAPAHGETSNLFFFISVTWRTTGDTELTALGIAFFALAGPVILLLTLLKMTDFPFWISESRTSISEPVKMFFLRLDAIFMTEHLLAQERYMILFWAWSMQIYYPCTCT